MRSRYTAYVRRDAAYLLRTWHVSTRPLALDLEGVVWLGLEVLSRDAGGEADAAGLVTFIARYLSNFSSGFFSSVFCLLSHSMTGVCHTWPVSSGLGATNSRPRPSPPK